LEKARGFTGLQGVASGWFDCGSGAGAPHAVGSSAPSVVAGEHTASTRGAYWHGGAPGLNPGDLILPPSVTRTRHTLSAYEGKETSRAGYQPTRVYLTSEYATAEVFAAMYPNGGWVYRVEPEGQLEQDPDVVEGGESWVCERARIVAVVPLDDERVIDILTFIWEQSEQQGRKGGAR